MMSNRLSLSEDDLTDNEKTLIEYSFTLFDEKMEDIRLLKEELYRITIELANAKCYIEDIDNERKDKLNEK